MDRNLLSWLILVKTGYRGEETLIITLCTSLTLSGYSSVISTLLLQKPQASSLKALSMRASIESVFSFLLSCLKHHMMVIN